jgi:hypothetical protein
MLQFRDVEDDDQKNSNRDFAFGGNFPKFSSTSSTID